MVVEYISRYGGGRGDVNLLTDQFEYYHEGVEEDTPPHEFQLPFTPTKIHKVYLFDLENREIISKPDWTLVGDILTINGVSSSNYKIDVDYYIASESELEFDELPTEGSENPVYSKGIKKYVDDAVAGVLTEIPDHSIEEVKLSQDLIDKINRITGGSIDVIYSSYNGSPNVSLGYAPKRVIAVLLYNTIDSIDYTSLTPVKDDEYVWEVGDDTVLINNLTPGDELMFIVDKGNSDDIINLRQIYFYPDKVSFPAIGVSEKLYVDLQELDVYVWKNSSYQVISSVGSGGGETLVEGTKVIQRVYTNNSTFNLGIDFLRVRSIHVYSNSTDLTKIVTTPILDESEFSRSGQSITILAPLETNNLVVFDVVVSSELSEVSFKTINGQSILGEGDIVITGGGDGGNTIGGLTQIQQIPVTPVELEFIDEEVLTMVRFGVDLTSLSIQINGGAITPITPIGRIWEGTINIPANSLVKWIGISTTSKMIFSYKTIAA